MRDYAIVTPQFWIGSTGRMLRQDPDAQRLAMYLITCPSSNMIGLYYLPIQTISHEIGMSFEGASKALRRLIEGGFADYDEATETVWVVEMARFQVGMALKPADKRVKGVHNELEKHRNCRFFKAFVAKYATDFHLLSESPSEAPSKPLRSQDQDQDQDQDHFSASASPLAGERGSTHNPKRKKPARAKTQERNSLFDAVSEITGTDPVVSGSHVGKLASLLAKADPPYSPAEVREFGQRFAEFCPWAAKDDRVRPTLGEVEKYIGNVRAKPPGGFAESSAKKSREAMASANVDAPPMNLSASRSAKA